jgi:hypothetical protein
MIRTVSVCPYCRDRSAGVDDDVPALVLAPDRADARPCPHLAFVIASLVAHRRRSGRDVPERSGRWLWVRGEGARSLPDGPTDPLGEYVDTLACGMYAGDSLPATVYRVAGGTAGVREAERPGTGDFLLRTPDGRTLAAYLDGFGVYSPTPDALVGEVRELAARCAAAMVSNSQTNFGDDCDQPKASER